jgi:hypothetical protein
MEDEVKFIYSIAAIFMVPPSLRILITFLRSNIPSLIYANMQPSVSLSDLNPEHMEQISFLLKHEQ